MYFYIQNCYCFYAPNPITPWGYLFLLFLQLLFLWSCFFGSYSHQIVGSLEVKSKIRVIRLIKLIRFPIHLRPPNSKGFTGSGTHVNSPFIVLICTRTLWMFHFTALPTPLNTPFNLKTTCVHPFKHTLGPSDVACVQRSRTFQDKRADTVTFIVIDAILARHFESQVTVSCISPKLSIITPAL